MSTLRATIIRKPNPLASMRPYAPRHIYKVIRQSADQSRREFLLTPCDASAFAFLNGGTPVSSRAANQLRTAIVEAI